MQFITSCVSARANDIDEMVDGAIEVTYRTFRKRVGLKAIKDCFPHYDWDRQGGLHMKNDWHVRYHRGKYQGKRVYYVVHSATEYIFG